MTQIKTLESLIEFQERFRTDLACERYLFSWRWPQGFCCRRCHGTQARRLRTRPVYQCCRCRRQTSVTAGTVLHGTKVPLRKWFWAIFLVARHKKSISALQLQRDLAIGSYRTAWFMLQRIRVVFGEKRQWPLKGLVEVDETLIGAHEKGDRPGKDPGHKAIVVGAVGLGTEHERGHHWVGVRLGHIPDYTSQSLGSFVRDNVERGSKLLTDGWRAYDHLVKEGYARGSEVSSALTKREIRVQNPLPHVHLLFSNLKTWLAGTFHGVTQKYLPGYLLEFEYRVNRRHDSPSLFGWVARRLMHHPPHPLAWVRAATG